MFADEEDEENGKRRGKNTTQKEKKE